MEGKSDCEKEMEENTDERIEKNEINEKDEFSITEENGKDENNQEEERESIWQSYRFANRRWFFSQQY